ncbi:TetR/AcrR family transcriptional regulator [Aeromicrobium sp. Marseille-Q0843]|uniref:TetR/AcrR family transcriptional regulator n=1 Tax=Aeromicrobium phoceense TaxID=2754045 RepID=A0A838XEV0_9ACTN|nr:TetR/AcrR family transcriptional regulator [Aeromicrobium phoceense]MBA4607318.1 TetR/AcrR family transcriptional regulator [Aeromicrobium phoceense]
MDDSPRVPQRRDAVANRERLIDTAEVYFAENGLDAPLHTLAAEAKVGTGTLYRNFASLDELVRALYDRYIRFFDELAERAVQMESGWEGIELVLDECMRMLLDKRIVSEVMRRQAINDPDYRPSQRWIEPLGNLVSRAIDEGAARPDLAVSDLSAVAVMLGEVRTFAPEHHEWIAARIRGLVLDGMRAHPHPATPLPELPEDFDQMSTSIIKRSP